MSSTKHQAYLICIAIVALICIGFAIYVLDVSKSLNVSFAVSDWQSVANKSTITNLADVINSSKPIDKINTDKFLFDIDYLIIQAWWPEPEQIYANKTHAAIKHSRESQNGLIKRIENGCQNINSHLRQKYFSNSAIMYVGNIDWMKENTPYCFQFDNIYTLPFKYDDLMYIDQIEQ